MSALSIPKSDRRGLAILREMPEDDFCAFLHSVENDPHSIPIISGVTRETAEQAKDALETMYRVRAYNEVSSDQFIEDVCSSLSEHKEMDTADEPKFRERLGRLLSINAQLLAAKATILRQAHERNFCSVRIITDARPIYTDNPSGPPVAMVITHTMKLDYHKGVTGDISELYLSFGSEDIAEFRAALARAEEKAQSLRDLFSEARIKLIEPKD